MKQRRSEYKGRVTLPAQAGMEKYVLELGEKWGVDAVRDSDGTKLSNEIMEMDFEVYTTLCLIREEEEWARLNPQCFQQMYLMSKPEVAEGEVLTIDIMKGFYKEQFKIDKTHDYKTWWEVIDRTNGKLLSNEDYIFDSENNLVVINNPIKWHSYTVSFLVYQIWEPVSMYNHITNNWKEAHKAPLDPRHPEVRKRILEFLDRWLMHHPRTDVVRFTTFFYNFDLIYNEYGKEKQVDWFGYLSSVSPLAIAEFEKVYGYRLRAEDFVDQGYYNTPFQVPTKKYMDWMEFQQKFVSEFAAECVQRVHKAGKRAIMFLGDHWCGTEPYGKYFKNIGLDAVVGAAGDGVTLRMISDIPVAETEARFYPYFFPDVFHKDGDPVGEAMKVWVKSRRAILRSPVDRIGYGGYLSLAVKFPDFIDKVGEICKEFRDIHQKTKGETPKTASFKVAILNSWGKIRTWQTHQVAHSLWNQRCYSYLGILEALSGMEFDIEFLSFSDIEKEGIPKDIGVIINAGDAGTSFSGAENWLKEEVVTSIREWVYNGGGFIGVGEPTAVEHQGAYFQLCDVMGVQKEIGFSVSRNKPRYSIEAKHFIMEGVVQPIDFGEGMNSIYKYHEETKVLAEKNNSCAIAVNEYGSGRSVYLAGLPVSDQNVRLLKRAIYWAFHHEEQMKSFWCSNIKTECAYYEKAACVLVINNDDKPQSTRLTDELGNSIEILLKPYGMEWRKYPYLLKNI